MSYCGVSTDLSEAYVRLNHPSNQTRALGMYTFSAQKLRYFPFFRAHFVHNMKPILLHNKTDIFFNFIFKKKYILCTY